MQRLCRLRDTATASKLVLSASFSTAARIALGYSVATFTLWTQSTYTALSNAMHHVEERLARWILMCHDRVDGDRIELTHDFIAVMLGVRRPSVTTALHLLEGNKLIYSERGIVTVRDRLELEVFAADAYGIPEREYARVIGQLDR